MLGTHFIMTRVCFKDQFQCVDHAHYIKGTIVGWLPHTGEYIYVYRYMCAYIDVQSRLIIRVVIIREKLLTRAR